jgi:hypothetical protein
VNLENALEGATPTRTQWKAWTRREPALSRRTYADVRRELRTASLERKDELLGALVRTATHDLAAFGVVAACLLPGIRHRMARYAPALDREEALAVMVVALYEAVTGYDTTTHPRFVAGRLLALPTRSLRRAAAQQRSWPTGAAYEFDTFSAASIVDLSPATMLTTAVDAGVITTDEAHLIVVTRIAGLPLRDAARRVGLAYETAKKRRQRAEARWIAWWLPDVSRTANSADDRGAA